MFEQSFKNIDDILHKDAGCGSELDYVEQSSWILFLKYLEDFEKDKEVEHKLSGKIYKNLLDEKYHWSNWAAPKNADGKLDHHKAKSGDDNFRRNQTPRSRKRRSFKNHSPAFLNLKSPKT